MNHLLLHVFHFNKSFFVSVKSCCIGPGLKWFAHLNFSSIWKYRHTPQCQCKYTFISFPRGCKMLLVWPRGVWATWAAVGELQHPLNRTYLPIHLFVHLPICPSIHHPFVYSSVCPPTHSSIYPPFCPSVHPPSHPPIHLSINAFMHFTHSPTHP